MKAAKWRFLVVICCFLLTAVCCWTEPTVPPGEARETLSEVWEILKFPIETLIEALLALF